MFCVFLVSNEYLLQHYLDAFKASPAASDRDGPIDFPAVNHHSAVLTQQHFSLTAQRDTEKLE